MPGLRGLRRNFLDRKEAGKISKEPKERIGGWGEERLEGVVGDETPYRVLARLGVKNTITMGGKFRLCENRNLKRGGKRARATASAAA